MRGLGDLIRPDWIRMFSPDELQMLVSGSTQPVDLKDLRSNCVYTGRVMPGGASPASVSMIYDSICTMKVPLTIGVPAWLLLFTLLFTPCRRLPRQPSVCRNILEGR